MKVLSYDTLSRNFTKAWAAIESSGEEVVVKRNRRRVASILPEPAALTALEVLGDLHGILGDAAGSVLTQQLAALREGQHRQGTLHEVSNP
jgi:hypothetical protein